LFGDDPITIQHQPYQAIVPERAEKQIPLPCWNQIAGVKHHSRRCDIRVPVIDRLLGTGLGGRALFGSGLSCDWSTGVLPAVGDIWPTVILAGMNDVDLISAHRSVFRQPELAREPVEGET